MCILSILSCLSGCHVETWLVGVFGTPKVSAEGRGHPLRMDSWRSRPSTRSLFLIWTMLREGQQSVNYKLLRPVLLWRKPTYWRQHTASLSSCFPLIQPFVVKWAQSTQYDKTSHAWQFMELLNVWGTVSTESSVACLVEHQTCIPRDWVQTLPMFCSVVTIFR